VIGPNGSGKSSLLRVLAGQDRDLMGEVVTAKNVKIGFLTQEPYLDPGKTVAALVEEGDAPVPV
jgi:energy-dependent translational throttle protein EttA